MKVGSPIGIPNSTYTRMIPVFGYSLCCETVSVKGSVALNLSSFRFSTALEKSKSKISAFFPSFIKTSSASTKITSLTWFYFTS